MYFYSIINNSVEIVHYLIQQLIIISMNRINMIRNQLACALKNPPTFRDIEDDVVIVAVVRTPLTKAKRGGLKDMYPEEMLAILYKAILQRTKIKKEEVDDFIIGNVLQSGSGFLSSRVSQALGGFDDKNSLYVINRLCGSGLQAIVNAHNAIQAGDANAIIAGGVESMSLYDFGNMLSPQLLSPKVCNDPMVHKYLISMGMTNESLCEKYKITRKEQDEYALESNQKAYKAQKEGAFDKEIIPIQLNDSSKTIVSSDDGIRKESTIESLSKLKPVFKENGSTTAGNASQLTDGAALCLLMNSKRAKELSCPILGSIKAYVCVGVSSEYMGIGPSVAIPALLKKINMTIDDIDLFEINEAFSGQVIYCIQVLNIPKEKVNVHGGAIALGHPLGCSGARLIVSILNNLRLYKGKYGIISACIGTGMGAACLIKNLQ